ncbi:hypothetical protein ABID56_001477 [Alkalibacillus flavidus]|uniref:DUF2929 family protein n=1 Tax=Alkalibacillus flavidus TaxID=546021 RepID=A0ABV2KUY5_9BACI
MRLISTAVWSFLLSAMIVYVIGSMAGISFNLSAAIGIAVVFTLATVILGETVITDEE